MQLPPVLEVVPEPLVDLLTEHVGEGFLVLVA
jgi:hypothetical protein